MLGFDMGYVIIAGVFGLFSMLVSNRLKSKFKKYSKVQLRNGLSGAEIAEKMLADHGIRDVKVISTPGMLTDHYNPKNKTVNLSEGVYAQTNASAAAVAAHEVGHALQWHNKETVFKLRERYIPLARRLQQIGFLLLTLAPVIGLLARVPTAAAIPFIGGILVTLCGAATYLIILPEEWDASFNKAMPILIEGEYITPEQEFATRRILRAAALTYAAGALASLLQVWRWLPLLLRR